LACRLRLWFGHDVLHELARLQANGDLEVRCTHDAYFLPRLLDDDDERLLLPFEAFDAARPPDLALLERPELRFVPRFVRRWRRF
jgi:hypothetical protein